MKETFPSNPSEAFASKSRSYDTEQEKTLGRRASERESPLEGKNREAAAYAAKPWMDVAVDLHDAKNNVAYAREIIDEGETVYDIDGEGSLDYLVGYGERRAHAAAEGKRGDELSSDEATLLGAYKAEASLNQAMADYNADTLTEEQMRQACQEANSRLKAAHERGDAAEVKRWRDVAHLASDYEDFHTGEVDKDDEFAVTQRIFPDARNAGFVLSNLDEDGAIRVDPTNLRFARHNVPQDIHNMQRMTDVYELFGEIQTREVQARKEQTLKKYGEYKDVHDAAEATLDYDAMLDDGEDGFAAARQKIEQQLLLYQGQGAAGEVNVKHYERLQDALSAYVKESERGNYNFPAVSHDLKAARGRSEIVKFLAKQYPKQEKPTAAEAPKSQSPESKNENNELYNPDETIIPTEEKGRTMRRSNFANSYFSESAHQAMTPENIKVLKDYMVHELRGEVDYAKRQNKRVVDTQATLFDRILVLKALNSPQNAKTKFAYQLVKHNTSRPDLMYAEFEQMSIKDIAEAIGFDITEYIDNYDASVAPHVSKEVYQEKPAEMPPMR